MKISRLSYVLFACCSSSPSPAEQLVSTSPEPAGVNCPSGGQAVEIGVDTNDNGVLDPSEVTVTTYVCNGTTAAPNLVDVIAEPPGANCTLGGQAIESGADLNGNGVLDPSEVTSIKYVCIEVPPNATTIHGSFTVHNSIDAAQLIGVTTITGGLDIEATGLTSIDLSSLVTVGGTITCNGLSTTTLDLPALQAAGGLHIGQQITTLHVPMLTTVGDLYEPSVAELQLPSLVTGGNLSFAAASSFDAPNLTTATSISFDGCDGMTTLSLPTFASGGLTVWHDAALTMIDAPMLASGSLSVSETPELTTISTPVLAHADVIQLGDAGDDLPLLTTFGFPALTTVGSVDVNDNELAALSFPALTTAGAFNLTSTSLTTVSLPLVTTIGSFVPDIISTPALATVNLPVLVTATGRLGCNGISIAWSLPMLATVASDLMIAGDNAVATLSLSSLTTVGGALVVSSTNVGTIALPVLQSVGSNVGITDDSSLTTLTAPALVTVGGSQLFIGFNASYPTCAAQQILAQVVGYAGDAETPGDDDAAICP